VGVIGRLRGGEGIDEDYAIEVHASLGALLNSRGGYLSTYLG
jgi:hypothetical protein